MVNPLDLPEGGLLDDRGAPLFREVFGHLMSRADEVWVAVHRVRLSGVNLRESEVKHLRRLRVLTADVSAHRLRLEAEALSVDPRRRGNLEVVRGLFRAGRLWVRAAPLGGWTPDFSIFRLSDQGIALLVGSHWFERPFPYRGPAIASIHGGESAHRMESRFRELWQDAHEIGTTILDLLGGAEEDGSGASEVDAGSGAEDRHRPAVDSHERGD